MCAISPSLKPINSFFTTNKSAIPADSNLESSLLVIYSGTILSISIIVFPIIVCLT